MTPFELEQILKIQKSINATLHKTDQIWADKSESAEYLVGYLTANLKTIQTTMDYIIKENTL